MSAAGCPWAALPARRRRSRAADPDRRALAAPPARPAAPAVRPGQAVRRSGQAAAGRALRRAGWEPPLSGCPGSARHSGLPEPRPPGPAVRQSLAARRAVQAARAAGCSPVAGASGAACPSAGWSADGCSVWGCSACGCSPAGASCKGCCSAGACSAGACSVCACSAGACWSVRQELPARGLLSWGLLGRCLGFGLRSLLGLRRRLLGSWRLLGRRFFGGSLLLGLGLGSGRGSGWASGSWACSGWASGWASGSGAGSSAGACCSCWAGACSSAGACCSCCCPRPGSGQSSPSHSAWARISGAMLGFVSSGLARKRERAQRRGCHQQADRRACQNP